MEEPLLRGRELSGQWGSATHFSPCRRVPSMHVHTWTWVGESRRCEDEVRRRNLAI